MRARTVVLDSNVLFSIELTDLFLSLATRRLVEIRWSEEILSEVRRSLALSGRLSPTALTRRLAAMQRALPDATVTFNVRDFPAEYCMPLGVEILTPDEFALETLQSDSDGVMKALSSIAQRRKLPSMSVGELLDLWRFQLPRFVELAQGA